MTSSATSRYLRSIGVRTSPRATSPFDPGSDPATLEGHLEQSGHLISTLKISMACWMVADERSTRRKIAAASRLGIPCVTGGGPFEVAVAQGALPSYLDLCQELGFSRVECGEGFTELGMSPAAIVRQIHERGMEAEYEVGKKHGGRFSSDDVGELIEIGRRWRDAGATRIVIEARESADDIGLFKRPGEFDVGSADRFAEAFGLDAVLFEAPVKASQFALIEHFGPAVALGNVRLEEVLRVEIYRRGLHSDAFGIDKLRPGGGGT